MSKEIIDKREMIKTDNGYKWVQHFESELSQEDFDKNKTHIELNIKTAKSELAKIDVRKSIQKKDIELRNEYKVSKEALKNFDKYMEESLEEIKEKVKAEKENMKLFVDNFKGILQSEIQKVNKKIMDEIKQWSDVVKQQEEQLKYYETTKTEEQ